MPKTCSTVEVVIRQRLNSCSIGKEEKRCKKMKNGGGPTRTDEGYLFDWVLSEILSRLPIKLIFRCKCVSKHWLAFISDPCFYRFYISRAAVPCHPWAFVPKYICDGSKSVYPHYRRLEDVHCGNNLSLPGCYVLPLPNSQEANAKRDVYYVIRAVSNGFILYGWAYPGSIMSEKEYFICNPVTKQWFALPPSPKYLSKRVSVGLITRVEAETILTSFKVVLLHCPAKSQSFLELEVFSSETAEWKAYSMKLDHPFLINGLRRVVYLNNNLHWIAHELGIIAYDPYNNPEKFRMIAFPDGYISYCKGRKRMCDAQQGGLVLCDVAGEYNLEGFSDFKIWILEDYTIGRWSLKHSIKKEDIIVDDKLLVKRLWFVPAAFHPYDADIIYLALDDYDLVSYNTRTRRLEAFSVVKKHEDRTERNRLFGWPPCFLVELPLWPVSVPLSLLSFVHR
ncbi:OLC1v1017715C1 [Oldenlandia corymbosa var. corymbosa]|nr:OLC1v1017715C1 [Oldenlandia corymbosa var. corymbosa]